MPYLASFHLNPNRERPYPYDVPAIRHARNIELDTPVTFIIGENGTGKSTLLETLACELGLPHLDGGGYYKRSYDAARKLTTFLELEWHLEKRRGFFFRAEDFGDYLKGIDLENAKSHLNDLKGEVPDAIIDRMKESESFQLREMRKSFGQDLDTFSHGEAYLHIMNQRINKAGIYLLDEPEAALSPAKQLSLIYFINEHLHSHRSQFIIATHSPMLMAYPGAQIFEITGEGMQKTPLEDTDHYSVTRSFLNNPEMYLRHF